MSEFDAVITLLRPHCDTESQRRMLFITAFNAYPAVLAKVDYSGSAAEFMPRSVRMLQGYGELETGTRALWHLLRTLKMFVGPDQETQIDALEAYANTVQPVPLTNQVLRAETTKSILISYSRRDRDAVLKLYADLQALGFILWRDLHDIQGGEPFWEEIKKGIDGCESVVLCMSPDALNSQFVQAEWHYARQQGKRVVPVVVADVDFATVPRWMSRLDWKDFRPGKPERETVWASFIKTLNTPYSGRKVPFMVQPLPPYFVERPAELEGLINALVNDQGAVAITAAVKGAGGFGKTTLAKALCHDTRIKGAFDDGILWVTLGEAPSKADLLKKTLDLIFELTGHRPLVESREAVKAELTKAIADRFILLVIDDLWRKADADLFLTGGKNSAVLITTRLDAELPDQTRFKQSVDAMRLEQAVALLSWDIQEILSAHQPALRNLAQRLGKWAVLLRLVNGALRKRMSNKASFEKALKHVNEELKTEGFKAFNTRNAKGRSEAVHSTISVSLNLLSAEEQKQFAQLAVFPEDVDVPFTTLEKLWGLNSYFAEKAASALNDAGLLLNFELEQCTIRVHDVIRQYLIDEHRVELRQWQTEFVAALDLHALPDEYAWRNIAYHLREADQAETLHGLLLNFGWLQAKLNATDANALLADFVGLTDEEPIRLVESALSMSAHVINQSKTTLASQLYGRLLGYKDNHPDLVSLLYGASALQGYLHLLLPTLGQAGGALIRTLPLEYSGCAITLTEDGEHIIVADGPQVKVFMWRTAALYATFTQHTDTVTSVMVQGELAFSASRDMTVKVWRWANGELLTEFTRHTGPVNGVAVQGELAFSASTDKTVKVWHWANGELLTEFTQHTGPVNGVAVQGELAFSASTDKTVKVWYWAIGELLTTFTQHGNIVNGVRVQGELAFSVSDDRTVKVWHWATGELLTDFTQHTSSVTEVSVRGELAFSASDDTTVKVWRWDTGEVLTTFTQHTSYINGVSVQNDLAFSASSDKKVKVWYWATGELLTTLTQHGNTVTGVKIQGELAFSASHDETVKVWRWATGELLTYFTQHTSLVNGVSVQGEWAFSASTDGTVKVWRWATGELLTDFSQHGNIVTGVCIQGELAFSTSWDKTVKVWHWSTGKLITTFAQHTDWVNGVNVQDELIFSASRDTTVKVWRWTAGEVITNFTQHTASVGEVSVQGDLAFSASDDNTVKVWRWATGELLTTFAQHTDWVKGISVQGELAFSASHDQTLKVWHWRSGEVVATFTADALLTCLAFEPQQRILLVGDTGGHVHVLRVVGLDHLLFPDGDIKEGE